MVTKIKCKICGRRERNHAKGYCHSCYNIKHQNKPKKAKYNKEYYQKHKEKISRQAQTTQIAKKKNHCYQCLRHIKTLNQITVKQSREEPIHFCDWKCLNRMFITSATNQELKEQLTENEWKYHDNETKDFNTYYQLIK